MRFSTLVVTSLVAGLVGLGAGAPARADGVGTITGRATNTSGTPLEDLDVTAWVRVGATWTEGPTTETAEDGTYALGVPAGTYRIEVADLFEDYVTEWWDDAPGVDAARDVTVTDGASVGGHDTLLAASSDTIVNLSPPRITGAATYGSRLTASPGTWSPAGVSLSYEWRVTGRHDSTGTGSSYELTAPTGGSTRKESVELVVTASAPGLEDVEAYADLLPVSAPATSGSTPGTRLRLLSAPTTRGVAARGRTLVVTTGRTSPVATAAVQWLRGARAIRGATKRSYRPTAADIGSRLRVRVTFRRGSSAPLTVRTRPTAPVRG